jgi:hypothetical protein
MKFPETVDAKAIGRDKLLPYVTFISFHEHASHESTRKLKEICADLHRISEQNAVETMTNMSQDEKTIAGRALDLNSLLIEYQVTS